MINNKHLEDDRYLELTRILMDAQDQASGGKGKERHADGENFEDQKICVINRWLRGSPVAGPLFQMVKKAVESSRLLPGPAIRELYGSINYAAAAIRLLEEELDVAATTEAANAEIRRIERKVIAHVPKTDKQVSGPTRTWFLPGGEPMTDSQAGMDAYRDSVCDCLYCEDTCERCIWTAPVCAECEFMNVPPSDTPCKKCIDKPFRPHFLQLVGEPYK